MQTRVLHRLRRQKRARCWQWPTACPPALVLLESSNLCLAASIEPGSVMKIFTFASLFEEGKVRADEIINCEGGRWQTKDRTIMDSHSLGKVSVSEVFSNPATSGPVKCAMRMTPAAFYEHLRTLALARSGVSACREDLRQLRRRTVEIRRFILSMGYELN